MDIEFEALPNVWYDYAKAPPGLQQIMNHATPPLKQVRKTVKRGKHYYNARKFPTFLLLIAYDDLTGKPLRCIIDPVPETMSSFQ